MEQSNFVQKALDYGFQTPDKKPFKTNDNWFGISLYHPDAVFLKGDRKIIMSLQGIYTPMNVPEKYREIEKKCKLQYIAFVESDNIIYETFTGEIPSIEFVDNFIK
jgi:hypothetical protein